MLRLLCGRVRPPSPELRELVESNKPCSSSPLAVAPKMVAYLLAVERQQQEFLPAEERHAGAEEMSS
jgi:hypothetical protein